MLDTYPPVVVRVWGDFALFTRPEMKVERVSYPLPTPSAARGILDAILFKPEMRWRVVAVHVLRPVRYFSLLRNEVKSLASKETATSWQKDGGGFYAPGDRTQRHSLALRDVDYLIYAQADVRPGVAEDPAKYRDQFLRRVRAGRCFATPYLGTREFSAAFAEPDGTEQPIDWTEELGPMLLDLEYEANGSGRGVPRFFDARVDHGIASFPAAPRQW